MSYYHAEVWAKGKRIRVFKAVGLDAVQREWSLTDDGEDFLELVRKFSLPGATSAVFGYGQGGERWDYHRTREQRIEMLKRWRKSATEAGYQPVGIYSETDGRTHSVVLEKHHGANPNGVPGEHR